MKFTKMQGLGNDYVYVNCLEKEIQNPSEVAIKISDRHFGVGSDGLVLILPSNLSDFRMRMFNSDGSEAEMCGNAIRCVGKYVYDNKLTNKSCITIETLAGIKHLEMTVQEGGVKYIKVNMGEPVLKSKDIPIATDKKEFISENIEINGSSWLFTGVSMGNPHVITYVENISKAPVQSIGSQVENHPIFPRKTNVEFVEVIDKNTLNMRVWERGTGETLACGTGACAAVVASVINGFSNRMVKVNLTGGELDIEWCEKDNCIYMTGMAEKVFEGDFEI